MNGISERLARVMLGEPPPSGSDVWFGSDLVHRDREELRAERVRLRMALAIIGPTVAKTWWWESARLAQIEKLLR